MNYPDWICIDCGLAHGRRNPHIATWHRDRCDVCGTWTEVTEPRDFGRLKDTWKDGRLAALQMKPAMRRTDK